MFGEKGPPQGKVNMVKISPAARTGECWLCGHRAWWHRLFGWFIKHKFDPLREVSFREMQRLDEKYNGPA